MLYVVEPPSRRLKRELGIVSSSPRRVRVGDGFKFKYGQIVCRKDDPRHTGEVRGWSDWIVSVQWENKVREQVSADDIEDAAQAQARYDEAV